MKKLLVKDLDSALVDESLQQLNSSCTPSTHRLSGVAPGGNAMVTMALVSNGSLYIKRIDIANPGNDIIEPDTFLHLRWWDNGNESGSTHEPIIRDGFDVYPLVGGALVSFDNVHATLEIGKFPLILKAPAKLGFYAQNSPAAMAGLTLELTLWSRPTEYEIETVPSYRYNKLRNFFSIR